MELIQNYISTLQLTMDQLPRQLIADVINVLQQARRMGNQVFMCAHISLMTTVFAESRDLDYCCKQQTNCP